MNADNNDFNPVNNDPFNNPGGPGGFGAAPKNKVSAQTVILGVIVVVGAGLLIGMRKFGMGPISSLTEVKIEYTPNPETAQDREEFDQVLDALARSSDRKQVPSEWLTRDPFVLEGFGVEEEPEEIMVAEVQEDQNEIARRQLANNVDSAAENVMIQSVMGGRIPLARIDGKLLQVGDRVETYLTIIGVEGRTVRFMGDDGRIFEAEVEGELREVVGDEFGDEFSFDDE